MQRGIILEIQAKHWVVLTPDGEFLQVPRANHHTQIGEEVTFFLKKQSRRRFWMTAVSGTVAAMIAMFFILPQLFSNNQAHAETYVYLDVNPSVAIALNSEKQVVSVEALNPSAKKLINHMDWKNEQVDEFVVNFLIEAQQNHYLGKKDQIVLTGITEEQKSTSTIQSLQKTIKTNQQIGKEVEVKTLAIPKQVQNKAKKKGLSPAKYAAWLLAKKEGQDISQEKLKETSINKLAEEIKPVDELLNHKITEQELSKIIEEEDRKESGATQSSPNSPTEPSSEKPTLVPDPTTKPDPPDSDEEDHPTDQPKGTDSNPTSPEPDPSKKSNPPSNGESQSDPKETPSDGK